MKTLRRTISDGIQSLYDVDFELGYFEREHVYVYAGDDHTAYTTQLSYVWQNDTQIELTVPEEYVVGTVINIRRIVPRDQLYVVFKNSTGITQLSLNNGNAQALMLIEEQDDGFKPEGYYEKQDLRFAGIYTIKELVDGVEDGDPVTMKQMFNVEEGFMSQFVTDATEQVDLATEQVTLATEQATIATDVAQDLSDLILIEGGRGLVWTTDIPSEAVQAKGYAINTSAGAVSIDLPTNPIDGFIIGFLDSRGTCKNYPIILGRNGKNIMGLAEDMTISENNTSVTLMYLEEFEDWRVESTTPQGELQEAVIVKLSHISLIFDAVAIASGVPITIGLGSGDMNVQSTQVEIMTPFDGGAEVTVGTIANPDVLLTSAFVDMGIAGAYGKTNDYHYIGTPEFKLFPTGTPTVGEARVTIYFN